MVDQDRTNSTRRQLLKAAVGSGIAGLTGVSLPAAGKVARSYDVIVVGAGMAGMYAARQLLAQGYKVLILEAGKRHGGRIYSRSLGDTRIEMGAEEFYLARNNPIYDAVVDELGKKAFTRAYVGEQMLSMDGKLCWEESSACARDADVITHQKYWSHFGKRKKHTDFSVTMAQDVYQHHQVDREHRAYHLYDNAIAGSVYGTSLENIGIASLARQDWNWTLSESIRVLAPSDIGYLDVLDRVWWKDVIDHLRLESAVTRIDSRGDVIEVTDISGDQYRALKVIITASVGVLQSETIEFLPALPEATVDAYRNIGMGHGLKIALRFQKPFWDERLAYLISEGLLSSCWVPTHYKVGSDDHILMCYPMGNNGDSLTRMAQQAGSAAAGDAAIVRQMLVDLDDMFDGAATALYIDSIVQDWTADPYVRGSYSYPMQDTYRSTRDSKRRQLAQPVDDRLFFAGEASSNSNPACVPGALQEGARAARQIHGLLNGVSSPA